MNKATADFVDDAERGLISSGQPTFGVGPMHIEERVRDILAEALAKLDGLRGALAEDHGPPPHRVIEAKSRGSRRRHGADAPPNPAAIGRTGRSGHRGSSDDPGNEWLTTLEAATYLRKSQSTLAKLRVYGGGPKFYRVGGKSVRYRREDLDLWASRNSHANTSEYGG